MICPTCKRPMLVVEYKHIELDYCGNCRGVWFDCGELELLLESEEEKLFLNAVMKSPEAVTDEKKRKCPVCRRTMKKAHIGESPHILIDACVQGDGLWFDGGEVGQLLRQVGKGPVVKNHAQEQVISFLEEVFQAPEKG
jgi:Zn-finger nucleic acid-binding protein